MTSVEEDVPMTDAGDGLSEGATEGAAVAPPPLPEPSSSKQAKAGSDSTPAASPSSSSSSSSTTKEATKKKGGKGKGKAKKGGAASGGAGAGAGAGSTSAFEQPWVEKYRPILLSDVVGNKEIIERLRVIAEDGNMPNIIIAGPPGTGKTTSIVCLARQLLGSAFKGAVLELNASDDRGISVVRDRIKTFAHQKVTLPAGRHKVIILDEADSMTSAAQQALRRTMELYSSTTRFALACNNSTKIIEPIQSRCAILRYSRLTDEQVLERVLHVCKEESVGYNDKGLEAIIFTAEGDMRQALNNLQSTFAGFGFVSEDNVFKVCDQPHPHVVSAIVAACLQGDFKTAHAHMVQLWAQGYAASDIVGTLFRMTRSYDLKKMPEPVKLSFLKVIGFTHMRIADEVTTQLQLTGLIAKLCGAMLAANQQQR